MISISIAGADDAPVLHQMLHDKAEIEGMADGFTASEDDIQDLLDRGVSTTIIASFDDEPAGMANYHAEDSTFTGATMYNITDLYTVPAYGGKGIAKAMLTYISDKALEKRYELKLIPLASNTRPIEWYKRLGAELSYDGSVLRVRDVIAFKEAVHG